MKVRVGIIFSNEKKYSSLSKGKEHKLIHLTFKSYQKEGNTSSLNIEDWWYVQYSRR